MGVKDLISLFARLKNRFDINYTRIKNSIYLSLKCKVAILQYELLESKKINKYPTTIQLPITYKCNFDCVMCGMRKLLTNQDFTAQELGQILEDKLYSKIVSVGINGGEPFVKKDLVQCIEVIIEKVPTLQSFSIISNGYFTELICTQLIEIKKICDMHKIKVNLALSVDGVEDMQDYMRGTKNAWKNVNKTLDSLLVDTNKYFHSLKIICTITKYNVFKLYEVENWAKKNNLTVSYNIATVNVRISNEEKVDDFSIFSDTEARMFAAEFFYKKFFQTHSERDFGIYLFIATGKRYAECDCKYNRWVTLTPNGQLGYCATHSKNLGNALTHSSFNLFNDNISYLEEIKKDYCDSCSHYIYKLDKKGIKQYYNELKRIDRC